jgi:ABC-type sugar transport system substrate-binding protein
MTDEEAVGLIKELLLADSQEELQKLIALHLPRMDNTFFSVLNEAANAEANRNPALGERLTALAQTLLPLRTLI